jgi:hypothetical protein
MSAPAYSGGGNRRGWGGGRRWGQAPGPTDNGWFDRVGTWFGGNTPEYAGAGQPASGTVGGGSPVYQPAPPTIAIAGAATTTPQAAPSVIVVPRT